MKDRPHKAQLYYRDFNKNMKFNIRNRNKISFRKHS